MSLNFFFAALFSAILAFIGFLIGYAMANEAIFEHSFGKLPGTRNQQYGIAGVSLIVIIVFFAIVLAIALAMS